MLYIIATPIGNIRDITLRAIDVLKECDVILCEDTRETIKLLNYYSISKPVLSYSDHSSKKINRAMALLSLGKKVCIVSNSGMPNISDPGIGIIKRAIDKNIKIEVIGGVSACINAVCASGFDGSSFIFLGFLNRAKLKITSLLNIAFVLDIPVVIYESPNRVLEFLNLVLEMYPKTQVCVAREMTKLYEEWMRGDIKKVIEDIKRREIKGEVTIVLKPQKCSKNISSIGFVCSGNTCRSVMAHYYLLKKVREIGISISVNSCGIYVNDEKISENTERVLKENGIEQIEHKPLQIDRGFIEVNDLILVMTRRQKKFLVSLFPEYSFKIHTLLQYSGIGSGDIYDPYGKDIEEYRKVFDKIKNAVDKIVELIMKNS